MFEADRTLGMHRWMVVRLSGSSRTEVVLLSDRFFEVTTHWVKRTVLCAGDDCSLCEQLPRRGLFYAACYCEGAVRMLELGALSASHLEQHCALLHGKMRAGLVLELRRTGSRSPVRSEVVGYRENAKAVDQCSLAVHVMALYQFPPLNPGETLEVYEQRVHGIALFRNKRLTETLQSEATRRFS